MSPRELLMEKRDKSMRRKLITFSLARHAYFWKTFDRIFGEANQ